MSFAQLILAHAGTIAAAVATVATTVGAVVLVFSAADPAAPGPAPAGADPDVLWATGHQARLGLNAAATDLATLRTQTTAMAGAVTSATGSRRNLPPIPPYDATDRSLWRAFRMRVMALISSDWGMYAAVDQLHASFMAYLAGDVLDYYLVDPIAVALPFADRAAVVAALTAKLDQLEGMFGESAAVSQARAGKALAALKQGDGEWLEFFAHYCHSARGANHEVPGVGIDPATGYWYEWPQDTMDRVFFKTRTELRNAVLIGHPDARNSGELFYTNAAALDPHVPRPQKAAPAPVVTKAAHIAPFTAQHPPIVTLNRARRFNWPESVPPEFRGAIRRADGTVDEDLRTRLDEADRCFFCREVGHESTECPKKATLTDTAEREQRAPTPDPRAARRQARAERAGRA